MREGEGYAGKKTSQMVSIDLFVHYKLHLTHAFLHEQWTLDGATVFVFFSRPACVCVLKNAIYCRGPLATARTH